MIRSVLHALVAVAALTTATLAGAQTSAGKPIRLICPFPPAGAVDIASRAIAAELAKVLGVTVTVENKPGAGGNLGGAEAARSPADGTTIFMTTSGINAINPVLYAKMPFDPIKDMAPVVALVSLSNVLVVHPSVKATSVAEVMALARAEPGKMNYASSGSGTSIHMSGEMFKYLAKLDIQHIPYKGSAPAVTDLLGGQVMMMFDNIPSALPHIKAGKLRPLAVTAARRSAVLPDVPTMAEAGVKNVDVYSWQAVLAPKGLPADIKTRFHAAVLAALNDPQTRQQFTSVGLEIVGNTPEQFAAFQQQESARWKKLIDTKKITAD